MKRLIVACLALILVFSIAACSKSSKKTPGNTQQTTTGGGTTQQTTTGAGTTQKAISGTLDTQITQQISQGNYKDGVYTGAGDKWKYGSENASVMTENGKITSITLRRLDTSGKEVNYDDWTGKDVNGKVHPNLKQARLDMSVRMLEKQSPDVDTISGATISTTNWKTAVQRALEKAKK